MKIELKEIIDEMKRFEQENICLCYEFNKSHHRSKRVMDYEKLFHHIIKQLEKHNNLKEKKK